MKFLNSQIAAGPSNRQILLHLVLSLMLVGCGFQLKGTGAGSGTSLSGVMIAVASPQPRSELTTAVVQQLGLEGAIPSSASDTPLVLNLGSEQFQQRNLSLTAQARSAEVELTMTVSISLERGAELLVGNMEAQVVRQFLNDPQNVVGKTEELRLLRAEMRQVLAAQITRRISHSLTN